MELEIEKVETEFSPRNSRKFMGVFVSVCMCAASIFTVVKMLKWQKKIKQQQENYVFARITTTPNSALQNAISRR